MNRWLEFFEGDGNLLSMTRLLCLLSFFPATYELIIINSDTALGYYLGAYVLGYLGGKGMERLNRKKDDC